MLRFISALLDGFPLFGLKRLYFNALHIQT